MWEVLFLESENFYLIKNEKSMNDEEMYKEYLNHLRSIRIQISDVITHCIGQNMIYRGYVKYNLDLADVLIERYSQYLLLSGIYRTDYDYITDLVKKNAEIDFNSMRAGIFKTSGGSQIIPRILLDPYIETLKRFRLYIESYDNAHEDELSNN